MSNELLYEEFNKAIQKDFEIDIDSDNYLREFVNKVGYDNIKEAIIDYWNSRKYKAIKSGNKYQEFDFYRFAQIDINIVKSCL